MMDLDRLRLLRELAQRGTMTAVAEASRLTPSAVSQQLATLEAEVQVKLLEPVGRGVKLTEAGRRLVAHAETILNAVEVARLDVGAKSATPRGVLNIGCFASFAKARLLEAARHTRQIYPDLSISIHEMEPEDASHAVRTGRCDGAIVYSHNLAPLAPLPGFVERRLLEEPMLLALPRRLRRLPKVVDLSALADCDWIGGSRGPGGYNLTSRACALAGFAPRITHSIDDYDLLLRMVAADLGISFAPAMALRAYPHKDVSVRTPAGPPLRRSISLIARPAVSSSPGMVALLGHLESPKRSTRIPS